MKAPQNVSLRQIFICTIKEKNSPLNGQMPEREMLDYEHKFVLPIQEATAKPSAGHKSAQPCAHARQLCD